MTIDEFCPSERVNWRSTVRSTMIAATLVCLSHGVQARSFLYAYTGQAYTNFAGADCLTAAMHASFRMFLPSALPANASFLEVTPTFWTASDGLRGFSAKSSQAAAEVYVSTDANGAIVNWLFELKATIRNGAGIAVDSLNLSGEVEDIAEDQTCHRMTTEAIVEAAGSWKR